MVQYSGTSVLWSPSGQHFMAALQKVAVFIEVHNTSRRISVGSQYSY